MEASFRKTSNSTNKFKSTAENILPPIRTTRNTKLNMQRRSKLASTLTEKYIMKYGSDNNTKLISDEVTQFLKRERLNERDLRHFELALKQKLLTKEKNERLKQNLINNLKPQENSVTENLKNNINTIKNEEDVDNSRMSGGSDLDKFDEKYLGDKMNEDEEKDFKKLNEENK